MKTEQIKKQSLSDRLVPPIGLTFVLLIFCGLITTCVFHDKLKYDNIQDIKVKMVVTEDVYRIDREGKSDETNFYLRIKSPFIETPHPDYLIRSEKCPLGRKNDTLICIVKYSTTLKHKWYSVFSTIGERDPERQLPNQSLFYVKSVIKIIKPNGTVINNKPQR